MRQRTIKKQIWLNQNEDKLLKEKSRQSGLSESEFIRSLLKGYHIKAQPTDEIRQFQREISGIANNINQLATIANTYQFVKLDDFKYLKTKLENFILRFEKKIYSRVK